MARARQKLLKFTFQDFGIDGLGKMRNKSMPSGCRSVVGWLVGWIFRRNDRRTIEHVSLLSHESVGG